MVTVQDFFNFRKLLKELNHTLITLIPKVGNPERTSQFRPISLCNTLYKTIAMIMVNQMKPILEKSIHRWQSAFILNHTIDNNVLVHTKSWISLRIWNVRKDMLPSSWIWKRPMIELSGLLFANSFRRRDSMNNGFVGFMSVSHQSRTLFLLTIRHGVFFKATRGIWQGGPLSPYLFILCMDVLTQRLHVAAHQHKCDILHQNHTNCWQNTVFTHYGW